MREVILFYAYDDSEFDTREACEAYEKQAYDTLVSISQKYTFFDANMNVLFPPTNVDIDTFIHWLEESTDKCTYLHRAENLTDEEDKFIRRECGYCICNYDFNYTIGWFIWDGMTCDWVQVDEQSTLIFC